MGDRNQWPIRIAGVIAELECSNDNGHAIQNALTQLDAMLLDAIEPMELKVYQWIMDNHPTDRITSQDIIDAFKVKPNHASMILSNLSKYFLLSRTLDGTGHRYIYKVYPPPIPF